MPKSTTSAATTAATAAGPSASTVGAKKSVSTVGGQPSEGKKSMKGEEPKKKKFDFKPKKADLRVKLPPIEDYDKKLEFHITDAPGRIISRLERLMGSDKVLLLDREWFTELIRRLEGEDKKAWDAKRKARVKSEWLRYRQLAIDGLIAPTADMQDIYSHPVYRVNQVVRRLQKFDYNNLLNPKQTVPPLTLMEPFAEDESGAIFKTFPGHVDISELIRDFIEANQDMYKEEEVEEEEAEDDDDLAPLLSRSEEEDDEEEEGEEGEEGDEGAETAAGPSKPKPKPTEDKTAKPPVTAKTDGEEEEEDDEEEEEEGDGIPLKPFQSLIDLQVSYGIDPDVDLFKWEPCGEFLCEFFNDRVCKIRDDKIEKEKPKVFKD